jgi:IclR family acetate operon transcriptional repressor
MQNQTEKVPNYPIGSVSNALRLLLMFRDDPLIRVSEASSALGVAPSTAHRLLAMLEYHGFVQQDPATRGYRAGPAVIDIGLSAVRSIDVRAHLLPYMERLCDEVDETVQLIVLEGADCLFLEAVESRQVVRTSSRVGVRLPAHTVSGGKALLAELPADRLRELYPSPRLEGRTPRSIRTRAALEAELARIRDLGFAVNLGESEAEVGAVGVVVRDTLGHPRAALAISAPLSRIQGERVAELAEALKRTAREAAAGLA